MPKYVVSRTAQFDMRGIARYTVEKWGTDQAVRYATGLRSCFEMLGDNPRIGRTCDSIKEGLRRYECAKHVIFYRQKPGGIRVVRVLHQGMTPTRSRFDE